MSVHPRTLPQPATALPHGAAFRFVEKVLSIGERMIIATRQVPVDEPWTEAHFPDTPIVPGVLLLEGMAQTCGILARFRNATTAGPAPAMLSALRSARFHRPVPPGCQLVYQAELIGRAGPLHSFRATTRVRDQLVAEAELILTVGAGPSLPIEASKRDGS